MAYKVLLEGFTTTGASTGYEWPGGRGLFCASDLGGGRVDLEFQHDGTNWVKVPIEGSTGICSHSTGDGALVFYAPQGTLRAFAVTASTTGTIATIRG